MDNRILANINKIKSMVLEFFNGIIPNYILGTGKMAKDMD